MRIVPLSAMAVSHLRGLSRFVHCPFVFCHQVSGERWTSPDKSFRAGRKKAKLDWVTFHTLRHMFGTRIIKMGVDIESAKELMGHDDIKTTDRYAKHAKADAVEALREARRISNGKAKKENKA